MKASIELDSGEMAHADFNAEFNRAEPDVGYMHDWVDIELISLMRYDPETGIDMGLLPGDYELSDYEHGQLVDAADDYIIENPA